MRKIALPPVISLVLPQCQSLPAQVTAPPNPPRCSLTIDTRQALLAINSVPLEKVTPASLTRALGAMPRIKKKEWDAECNAYTAIPRTHKCTKRETRWFFNHHGMVIKRIESDLSLQELRVAFKDPPRYTLADKALPKHFTKCRIEIDGQILNSDTKLYPKQPSLREPSPVLPHFSLHAWHGFVKSVEHSSDFARIEILVTRDGRPSVIDIFLRRLTPPGKTR